MSYAVYQCLNDQCRFRFPAEIGEQRATTCPLCGTNTAASAAGNNQPGVKPPRPPRLSIELLLDNIRSVYNVGALFRTADGAGVSRLHLCGITATPAHPRLAKTALGAGDQLAWTHSNNAVETAVVLQADGFKLWCLEDTPAADVLFDTPLPLPGIPIVLVVGNEKAGVDPALLALADRIVSLPMQGGKESLNVAVACGIALYHLNFSADR